MVDLKWLRRSMGWLKHAALIHLACGQGSCSAQPVLPTTNIWLKVPAAVRIWREPSKRRERRGWEEGPESHSQGEYAGYALSVTLSTQTLQVDLDDIYSAYKSE